jgi:tRNA pseudouridine55 synthase
MDGIIVVDKPAGFTSFDVVAKLRGICQTKKMGHGGTLDPRATGVLPVFVGGAAKAVDLAPCQDKAYTATLLFGLATDTGDITGRVLQRAAGAVVAERELLAVLPRFTGPQTQTPPMYSAVKVEGKPLYKYAREGKTVRRTSRQITIHTLELAAQEGENRFVLKVACGKGTYIRALAEDIGAALGVPATLAALRRTRSGCFDESQALALDELQRAKDAGRLEERLLPASVLFGPLPRIEIGETHYKRLQNGAKIHCPNTPPGRYQAGVGGGFGGLVQVDGSGEARAVKLFARRFSEEC